MSVLPLLWPSRPICSRNLPWRVNFSIWWPWLVVSHTLSLPSTVMPCIEVGHSYPGPGPPHDDTRLPAMSNSRTGGATSQQI